MNELLKFKLELQSMMGSVLKKEQATSHGVFTSIDRDVKNTQRGLNALSNPIKVHVDTSGLHRAGVDIDRVNNKMNMLRTSGAMFLGTMAAQGVSRAAGFVQQQIGDVLKGGMAAGAVRSDFQAMAGAGDGAKLYTDLKKYIADSKFGPELNEMATGLMQAGINVKEILPDLKMFGDITGGNVEKMKMLGYAYGQVVQLGHLQAQDKNQLSGAGFNPLLEIKRTTGLSTTAINKMMESGAISADMVRNAMITATSPGGRYSGRLEGYMGTAGGMLEAQMGSIESIKQDFGESLTPSIENLLRETKPLVDDLPRMLAELKPEITDIVKGMADMVKWTRTHADTLKMWVGVVKVGVEAWGLWKAAALLQTAINWGLVKSLGIQAAETGVLTTAMNAESGAIAAQTLAVDNLTLAWNREKIAASGAALANEAAATNNLLLGQTAAFGMNGARAATAGVAGLAGSIMSKLSTATFAVGTAYIAGEIINEAGVFPKVNGKNTRWQDYVTVEGVDRLSAELKIEQERKRMNQMMAFKFFKDNWNAPGFMRRLNGNTTSEDFGGGLGLDFSGMLGRASAAVKGAGVPMIATDTRAISGGGARQIVINIDSFIKHQENRFENTKDAARDLKEDFERMFLEVVQSANAAM